MRSCNLTRLAALLCLCWSAVAQITTFIEIDGKEVQCLHSGLYSSLEDCGARSNWYTYVFVGSISAITPIADDEDELKILPDEVFSGHPGPSLTVLTSQARCLSKLNLGDRWLFFLREEPGKPIVLDYYGNDSRPALEADEQIKTCAGFKPSVMLGFFAGGLCSQTQMRALQSLLRKSELSEGPMERASLLPLMPMDGTSSSRSRLGSTRSMSIPSGPFWPILAELK